MAVKGQIYCNLGELVESIGVILADYSDWVCDVTAEEIKAVAKEGAKEAKKAGEYKNRRPKYRKSISYKSERKDMLHPHSLIYARNHEYSLTHLLENGHKLWNAPLRKGTRAFPHWVEADELVAKELPERLIRRFGSGV